MGEVKHRDLTATRARNVLNYDPETGIFKWKISVGRIRRGSVAGSLLEQPNSHTEYWRIQIDGVHYLAHRLAWLITHGRWPTVKTDHRNGNGLDNRISNIREATSLQNSQNVPLSKSNKSGYKGVSIYGDRGKYQAQISVNGNQKHLGLFDCPKAAHAAYCNAAKKFHGEFANFGEYSNTTLSKSRGQS